MISKDVHYPITDIMNDESRYHTLNVPQEMYKVLEKT